MRVLVTGGRDFQDAALISETLEPLGVTVLIEGEARGADSLARAWAESKGIKVEPYKADWLSFGRAAGHIRNGRMLKEGKPDLVVAFPGGTGTANMVRQARHAGVRVREVAPRPRLRLGCSCRGIPASARVTG